MYQANAACLHCGKSFDQEGRGRARHYCFECLPHKATTPPAEYARRSSQLNRFRATGSHSACCPAPKKQRPPLPPLPTCSECGVAPARSRGALTCSAACAKERRKRTVKEYRAGSGRAIYLRAKRDADQQRKRAKRTTRVDRFRDEEIFERDRWTCQLCGKRVKRQAKFPHPDAPTIDHIVPLSKHGEHTRENSQCAHNLCNARKNTKACGSQLRLIG
jgi:5-methylcytosine-specific restriction endonuclease McrA